MQPESGAKKLKRTFLTPTSIVVFSFALVIFVGAFLLSLPISSRDYVYTPFLDCLFTATSATSVTGMVVRDTYYYWSTFGQTVILLLIQIGGLGLVTFTMFFGSFAKRRFRLKELALMQESVSFGEMNEVRTIVRMVVTFSLTIELIGAAILSLYFVPAYGSKEGLFVSLFMSVSSYCSSGFDLVRGEPFSNMISLNDSPLVLLTVSTLTLISGLSVIVWYDTLGSWRNKRKLSLHSWVVFTVTGLILLVGTVFIYLFEHANPLTLGGMSEGMKWVNAFFQTVNSVTAGFNSFPNESLLSQSKVLVMIIMFIGGAPASTAGGIKVTTFWVLAMTIISVLRGRPDTVIRGKKVGYPVVYKAMTILIVALTLCVVSFIIIIYSEPDGLAPLDAAFEAVSAFSNTGLTPGLTPGLSTVSLVSLMVSMFLGRVGLVSFAYSISILRARVDKNKILPEGKILVG